MTLIDFDKLSRKIQSAGFTRADANIAAQAAMGYLREQLESKNKSYIIRVFEQWEGSYIAFVSTNRDEALKTFDELELEEDESQWATLTEWVGDNYVVLKDK